MSEFNEQAILDQISLVESVNEPLIEPQKKYVIDGARLQHKLDQREIQKLRTFWQDEANARVAMEKQFRTLFGADEHESMEEFYLRTEDLVKSKVGIEAKVVSDMATALEFVTAECSHHVQMLKEKGVLVAISHVPRAEKALEAYEKAQGV